MDQITTSQIIDKIGAETIADAVGVSSHSIRHAKFTGVFSASWFDLIEGLCIAEGISCPRNLFTFKSSSVATAGAEKTGSLPVNKRGSLDREFQGEAAK